MDEVDNIRLQQGDPEEPEAVVVVRREDAASLIAAIQEAVLKPTRS